MRNFAKKILFTAVLASGIMSAMSAYGANPNWYRDGSGWHYYVSNSATAKDRWIQDGGKWYHFNGDGVMQTGWLSLDDHKYYLNGDGSMVTGLVSIDGKRYYFYDDGSCAIKAVTPDWYLTNENGEILESYRVVAGVAVEKPQSFVKSTSYTMDNWRGLMSGLNVFGDEIYNMTGGSRQFRVYGDRIEYCSGTGSNAGVLITLAKAPATGGWQIKIATALDRSSTDTRASETYDYQVLRYFCYCISGTASELDDALYDSWSLSNKNGINRTTPVVIGDAAVLYHADNGSGTFTINPAQ